MSHAESMEKKYEAKKARWPSLAQPWTIHRVPHSIRAVDKDAYEPKMLSIGPYHRSKPNLQAMEDHKWRYVQAIIRQDKRNPKRELSDYLKEMEGLEVEVRSFYSEKIEIESKEFVEMMLLDGCFIVELFLNVNNRNAIAETDDPIYSTKWILPIIRLDMLLLENQLPFKVVKRIFELVNGPNPISSIVELALRFFKHLMPMKKEIPLANSIPDYMNSSYHLLHLCHLHLLPPPPPPPPLAINLDNEPVPPPLAINLDNEPVPPPRSIMSVSDLQYFFQLRKKENASSIVDFDLKVGPLGVPDLYIPALCINHSTNSVFRNLIAWEQCYLQCGTQFTGYAIFMDCLVDSPQDVEILKNYKIIEHWLGNNEEVALLFNQMCIGITCNWEDNFLSNLPKQVADMKSKAWPALRYMLLHRFFPFHQPWNLINYQIAIMTVALAIVQIIISL